MSISLLFWIVYVISLFFSAYVNRVGIPAWSRSGLIFFLLIGILGYGVFGAAIHR